MISHKSIRNLTPQTYIFLGIVILSWFALFLGNRPFATPDEARYVEIPREMLASGDFITPRLNGVKYFEKPPLFYWMEAAAQYLFGLNEVAMRLWGILLATLGCLGTMAFANRFYSTKVAIASGFLLAATPLYFALSRLIILDMPVTVFVSLSLFAFLMAVYTPPGIKRRFLFYAFTLLCALGIMTKGIMALAIPGPIIIIWATVLGQWHRIFPAYIPTGLLLFLTIAAPWHILASLHNPEFAHKYFVVEHIHRFLTNVHLRAKPFWFYIPVLFLGFFPWTLLLWRSIKDAFKGSSEQRSIALFLLIWVGWVFAFFSVSTSKLIPYVLPAFPALAILTAHQWMIAWKTKDPRGLRFFSMITAIFGLIIIFMVTTIPSLLNHIPHKIIDFVALGVVLFMYGLIGIWFIARNNSRGALIMLPVTAITIIATLIHLSPDLQRPSIKPLTDEILTLKTPTDRIGSFKAYFQDLPVHLRQTVIVAEAAGELEFGMHAEDTSSWMINEKKFLELWNQDQRMLIVVRQSDLAELTKRLPQFQYKTLKADHSVLLITNKDNS